MNVYIYIYTYILDTHVLRISTRAHRGHSESAKGRNSKFSFMVILHRRDTRVMTFENF